MALLIRVDGGLEQVAVKGDFEKLQKLVEGYVIFIPHKVAMNGEKYSGFTCNEDGQSMNLPYNRNASNILNQKLLGHVVLVKNGDI